MFTTYLSKACTQPPGADQPRQLTQEEHSAARNKYKLALAMLLTEEDMSSPAKLKQCLDAAAGLVIEEHYLVGYE